MQDPLSCISQTIHIWRMEKLAAISVNVEEGPLSKARTLRE